jgi:hypothetical protein
MKTYTVKYSFTQAGTIQNGAENCRSLPQANQVFYKKVQELKQKAAPFEVCIEQKLQRDTTLSEWTLIHIQTEIQ